MMAGGPVSWSSKRQDVVALSTAEAEYIAPARRTQQSRWAFSFMSEIGYAQELPMRLYGDNSWAVMICKNPKIQGRVKHIETREHFIREMVEREELEVEYIPSEENPADILTKSLGGTLHMRQVMLLGLQK